MKQITEIDDPRLVKALAHPLRVQILRALQDRVGSPSDIAEEISAPLGNVSYHVRFLERVGVLEFVEARPRRGALEHYYRARGRLRITDHAWAQVPEIVKNAMVGAALDQAMRYAYGGASIGGFERADAIASRRAMRLDDRGFQELGEVIKALLERASEIESESAKRIVESGHENGEIDVGLVTMLFEAPPSDAALPMDDHQPRKASRSRSAKAAGRGSRV